MQFMLDLKNIGVKIRYYRKKKGMTVDQLAAAVCKSKSSISKYESGQIVMDILSLYDIARPLMPTSTKVLLSKTIQEETAEFEKSLRLSKEDIRLMKLYNMLTIKKIVLRSKRTIPPGNIPYSPSALFPHRGSEVFRLVL